MSRVISDKDLAELAVEPREALTRELLECYGRHRAAWEAARKAESEDAALYFDRIFNGTEGDEVRAMSQEVLEIAARHGVPRAIAALNGKMVPEMKAAYATARAMVGRDRAEGDKHEDESEQPKRRRRSPRKNRERA